MANVARISPETAVTTSLTGLPLSKPEDVFSDLRARLILYPNGLPKAFAHGKAPTDRDRAAITELVATIRRSLSREADFNEIGEQVRFLQGGLKLQAGVDAAGIVGAYGMALDGVKLAPLKKAVLLLIRGKAPDAYSKTFVPSSAELLAYCEQIERDAHALATSMERLLDLPNEVREEPMSEEHCRAMREKIAQLARPKRTEGGDV